MAYLVSITARATRDLTQLYDEINASDSAAARHWYRGLKQYILSLEEHPVRCPATQKTTDSGTCSMVTSLIFIV